MNTIFFFLSFSFSRIRLFAQTRSHSLRLALHRDRHHTSVKLLNQLSKQTFNAKNNTHTIHRRYADKRVLRKEKAEKVALISEKDRFFRN